MCRALSCRLSIAERRKPCVTSTVAEIPGCNGKKGSLLPAGVIQRVARSSLCNTGALFKAFHPCGLRGGGICWLQTLTGAGFKVYTPWAQKGLEIFPKNLPSY